MGTIAFRDFLAKKATEQNHPRRKERREEWIASVERLFDRIRTWLAESDPDRFLDIVPFKIHTSEPALGNYEISALKIGVGDAAVEVRPMGRDALGLIRRGSGGEELRAEGRVDIDAGGRKYILYRSLQDGRETWYALDEDFRPRPFDRAELEAILQDLLS